MIFRPSPLIVVALAALMAAFSWPLSSSSPSTAVHGFVVVPLPGVRRSGFVLGAGFGGGASADSPDGKKRKKGQQAVVGSALKPKQQWDRYADFKGEDKVRVAVRCKGESDEWLEVGRVRSKGNEFPGLAVVIQRALIAEVRERNESPQHT